MYQYSLTWFINLYLQVREYLLREREGTRVELRWCKALRSWVAMGRLRSYRRTLYDNIVVINDQGGKSESC